MRETGFEEGMGGGAKERKGDEGRDEEISEKRIQPHLSISSKSIIVCSLVLLLSFF